MKWTGTHSQSLQTVFDVIDSGNHRESKSDMRSNLRIAWLKYDSNAITLCCSCSFEYKALSNCNLPRFRPHGQPFISNLQTDASGRSGYNRTKTLVMSKLLETRGILFSQPQWLSALYKSRRNGGSDDCFYTESKLSGGCKFDVPAGDISFIKACLSAETVVGLHCSPKERKL